MSIAVCTRLQCARTPDLLCDMTALSWAFDLALTARTSANFRKPLSSSTGPSVLHKHRLQRASQIVRV